MDKITIALLHVLPMIFCLQVSTVQAVNSTTAPESGEKQTVYIDVQDMSIAQFENKSANFTSAVLQEVTFYCREFSTGCGQQSYTTVTIVPGYPVLQTNLRVAFYVATSSGSLLSKDTLAVIVTRARANLTTILGHVITGLGRLHLTLQPFPTSGTSNAKWNALMAKFFGGFFAVVGFTMIVIAVVCWLGRKANKKDEVRPLTTSALHLVEEPGLSRQVKT